MHKTMRSRPSEVPKQAVKPRAKTHRVYIWVILGVMEKEMETIIMENQMEKKMENEMETMGNIDASCLNRAL